MTIKPNDIEIMVVIEWLDSKGITPAWEYLDEIEPLKPAVCKSIGYLIDDNEDYKTIAQTLSNTQLVGRLTIPACSITKMTELDTTDKGAKND